MSSSRGEERQPDPHADRLHGLWIDPTEPDFTAGQAEPARSGSRVGRLVRGLLDATVTSGLVPVVPLPQSAAEALYDEHTANAAMARVDEGLNALFERLGPPPEELPKEQ